MQLSRLFFSLASLLAPVAFVGTVWLYLYPLFDAGCSFPSPPNSTAPAPFRLLALGDPQLEGDSSLPKAGAKIFRSLDNIVEDVRDAEALLEKWELIHTAIRGIPRDLVRAVEGYVRKPLDIWGNDWYLAHVVRTLRWAVRPSHVAVLGDLLGSQWVKDVEFERRGRRFWGTVFAGMKRVPDRVMVGVEEEDHQDAGGGKEKWGGTVEVLGADKDWENRVINIAGNHDIGYAGDIDGNRVDRFERAFGKVNWDIVFELPREGEREDGGDVPALRLVILNSMNLDTPALDGDLQRETYDFVNHVISTSRSVNDKTHATILLTHIPLHKESGVCVDSPFFDFFENGGVKEQNMLSEHASKIVLESIFGLSNNQHADGKGFGRRGIIINGHDHAGCDVLHYTTQAGVESACPQTMEEHEIHLPPALINVSVPISPGESWDDSIAANETATEHDGQVQDERAEDSQSQDSSDESPKWQAQPFPHLPYKVTPNGECIALSHVPRIREVTLRSMMGEFSGYAGFLSAWFDPSLGEKGEWKLEVNTCGLGVQHWWWGVHIIDLILAISVVVGCLASVFEQTRIVGREQSGEKKAS